jgi:hypothetical protein
VKVAACDSKKYFGKYGKYDEAEVLKVIENFDENIEKFLDPKTDSGSAKKGKKK